MKTQAILLAAALAAPLTVAAQCKLLPAVPDHDNSAFRTDLNGPVRSQVMTVIIPEALPTLPDRGQESYILEERYMPDGTRRLANLYTLKNLLVAKTELLYDRNGFATEEIYSDLNGNMLNRITYAYTPGARTWHQTVNYDPYYNPLGIYTYYYDGDGHLSQLRETGEEGKTRSQALFAYDAQGRFVEQHNYDAQGRQTAGTELFYTRSGRVAGYRTVAADDSLRVYAEATYQGDSLLTNLTINLFDLNRPSSRISYDFDPLGNILRSTQTDLTLPDAKPVVTDYIYEWDLHGNWTKQAIIRDGKEQVAATREITYYEE